jgi:hypothetical protein
VSDELIRKRPTSREELVKIASDGRLFAVLDACDEAEVPSKIDEIGRDRAACLYKGALDEDVQEVAPYLVSVDTQLLDWMLETFDTRPWGVFVVSTADLRTLRQHLRDLLVVEGIDGEPMYFFFYDPRVLSTFIDTCDAEELEELYGPVMAYGVLTEGEDAAELLIREA